MNGQSLLARRRLRAAAIVIAGVLLPSAAHANAGTPLMWAAFGHLVFGNAVIGIVEGLILAILFRTGRMRAALWMIGANYFSAIAGLFLLPTLVGVFIPTDFTTAWAKFWSLLVATWFVTILLEYPFVRKVLRAAAKPPRSVLRASLLVQSISYAGLMVWYGVATPLTLYTDTERVSLAQMNPPDNLHLYYIDPSGARVLHQRLGSAEVTPISTIDTPSIVYDSLMLQPSGETSGTFDLLHMIRADSNEWSTRTLISAIPGTAAPLWQSIHPDFSPFGKATQLGSAAESPWKIRTSVWAGEGLSGYIPDGDREFRIAFETPFVQISVRNAIHLPRDLVLLRLGSSEICLFDINTHRIAVVANGYGFTVLQR